MDPNLFRKFGENLKKVLILAENIDPIGSCVGQRGTRVQSVLAEIGDEKIDIILWDEDVEQFIINALSPAKCDKIVISSKDSKATVFVPEDSLSLAIGKNGQNVRLASKLTGWGIDIVKSEKNDDSDEKAEDVVEEKPKKKSTKKKTKKIVDDEE